MNQYLKYFIYFLLGVIIYYFLFNSSNAKSQKLIEGFDFSLSEMELPLVYINESDMIDFDAFTDPRSIETRLDTRNIQIPVKHSFPQELDFEINYMYKDRRGASQAVPIPKTFNIVSSVVDAPRTTSTVTYANTTDQIIFVYVKGDEKTPCKDVTITIKLSTTDVGISEMITHFADLPTQDDIITFTKTELNLGSLSQRYNDITFPALPAPKSFTPDNVTLKENTSSLTVSIDLKIPKFDPETFYSNFVYPLNSPKPYYLYNPGEFDYGEWDNRQTITENTTVIESIPEFTVDMEQKITLERAKHQVYFTAADEAAKATGADSDAIANAVNFNGADFGSKHINSFQSSQIDASDASAIFDGVWAEVTEAGKVEEIKKLPTSALTELSGLVADAEGGAAHHEISATEVDEVIASIDPGTPGTGFFTFDVFWGWWQANKDVSGLEIPTKVFRITPVDKTGFSWTNFDDLKLPGIWTRKVADDYRTISPTSYDLEIYKSYNDAEKSTLNFEEKFPIIDIFEDVVKLINLNHFTPPDGTTIGLIELCQKLSGPAIVDTDHDDSLKTLFKGIGSSSSTELEFGGDRGCKKFDCGSQPGYNKAHENWIFNETGVTDPGFNTCFNVSDNAFVHYEGNTCDTPLCCTNNVCKMTKAQCTTTGDGADPSRRPYNYKPCGGDECNSVPHCCTAIVSAEVENFYDHIIQFKTLHSSEPGGVVHGKDILYYIYDNLLNIPQMKTEGNASIGNDGTYGDTYEKLNNFFNDMDHTSDDISNELLKIHLKPDIANWEKYISEEEALSAKFKAESLQRLVQTETYIKNNTPLGADVTKVEELKFFIMLFNKPLDELNEWSPLDYYVNADNKSEGVNTPITEAVFNIMITK